MKFFEFVNAAGDTVFVNFENINQIQFRDTGDGYYVYIYLVGVEKEASYKLFKPEWHRLQDLLKYSH